MRGEYKNIPDARKDLGVRTIIKDPNFYPTLKLWADFVTLAGFKGLLVCLDEMAVLSRLSSVTFKKNLETILQILNETIPGTARHLGFLFGGTETFYSDRNKGMFSYEALKSRLADNQFSSEERPDFTGPVIHLPHLTESQLQVLCENIRNVFALGNPEEYLLSDRQINDFMKWLMGRLGAKMYESTRSSVQAFVGLLSQLKNYPDTNIETYLGEQTIQAATENDLPDSIGDDLPSAPDGEDLFKIKYSGNHGCIPITLSRFEAFNIRIGLAIVTAHPGRGDSIFDSSEIGPEIPNRSDSDGSDSQRKDGGSLLAADFQRF